MGLIDAAELDAEVNEPLMEQQQRQYSFEPRVNVGRYTRHVIGKTKLVEVVWIAEQTAKFQEVETYL